jgi:hypothetical protein
MESEKSQIPIGCESCPNRSLTQRPFLHITKNNLAALGLSLLLIPCFFEDRGKHDYYARQEPNMPLLMVLLPAIGVCLGIDITPSKN